MTTRPTAWPRLPLLPPLLALLAGTLCPAAAAAPTPMTAVPLMAVDDTAEAPPRPGFMEFVSLRPLLFAHDADIIDERVRAQLEDAALYIRHSPRIRRVLLQGHTDVLADGTYNAALSQRRVEAVRTELLALGVAGHLLHVSAHGSSAPTDENWTAEGRSRNRRVEIYVLSHTP